MSDFITTEEAMKLIKQYTNLPVYFDNPLEKLQYGKYWLVVEYHRRRYWKTKQRFDNVNKFKKWISAKNRFSDIEYIKIYGVTDQNHYDKLVGNIDKQKSFSIPVSIFDREPPRGASKYRLKMHISRNNAVNTYNSLIQSFGTDKNSDTYVTCNRPPIDPYSYFYGITVYVNMESEDFVPLVMMHITDKDSVLLQVYEGV